MKKLVLMFSILLLGIGIFAQTPNSTSDSLLQSTAVERIYSDLSVTIGALATQLKVPAEFVYKTMVKQQVISAYAGMFIPIALLLVFILFWGIGHLACKFEWGSSEFDLSDYYNGLGIVFIVLMGICIILTLAMTAYGIMKLNNPDYYAIKDILNMIRY